MIAHFNGPLFEFGNNLVFQKCVLVVRDCQLIVAYLHGLYLLCQVGPTEGILEKCKFFSTPVNINKFIIDNILACYHHASRYDIVAVRKLCVRHHFIIFVIEQAYISQVRYFVSLSMIGLVTYSRPPSPLFFYEFTGLLKTIKKKFERLCRYRKLLKCGISIWHYYMYAEISYENKYCILIAYLEKLGRNKIYEQAISDLSRAFLPTQPRSTIFIRTHCINLEVVSSLKVSSGYLAVPYLL